MGLRERPGRIWPNGCRTQGRPRLGDRAVDALGILTPQGPPAPSASWGERRPPFPARGEPEGTRHVVIYSKGVLAVWDLPAGVAVAGGR